MWAQFLEKGTRASKIGTLSSQRSLVQVSKSFRTKAALKRPKSWEASVSFGSISGLVSVCLCASSAVVCSALGFACFSSRRDSFYQGVGGTASASFGGRIRPGIPTKPKCWKPDSLLLLLGKNIPEVFYLQNFVSLNLIKANKANIHQKKKKKANKANIIILQVGHNLGGYRITSVSTPSDFEFGVNRVFLLHN